MKKILFLVITMLVCLLPSVCHAALDVVPGVSSGGNLGTSNLRTQGGWHSGGEDNIGVRMTVYSESGRRVSNSVDIVFSQETYNVIIGQVSRDGYPLTTIKNKNISKVDYIKNNNVVGKWDYTDLSKYLYVAPDHSSYGTARPGLGEIAKYLLSDNVQYFYKDKNNLPNSIKTALHMCSSGGYTCKNGERYFAVFEPTMYVWAMGYPIYGTAYELANTIMPNDDSSLWTCNNNCKANNLSNHIDITLPLSLRISGEVDNKTFYSNIGISEYCSNGNTCFGRSRMKRSDILNKGIAIGVYDWTNYMENISENITCNVKTNVNECGTSTIIESTRKECIVDNTVYSYLSSCNLYCSDSITTDFSGVYDTFIGTNKLNAIKSGQYQSIKGNPTITVTKTCYQSKTSNECPDVTESFKTKLKSDYKTNNIVLSVDGNNYTLIGNATIINNGYSSATITYDYKLDQNVNKYINIETMKGDSLTDENKNKVIINGTPMIITSKGSYGKYTYNLDVSKTILNKYIAGSTSLTNFKNASNDKYNINNIMTITYISEKGDKKSSYTNEDLNYSCSYVKYDSGEQCICEEDKCCDSVTCEPVECPGENPCVCDSEYGCLNDGKCTPIVKPKDNGNKDICNPEKETCFPNIVYRPISLTNPFPGILGEGRTPGSNWNRILKEEKTGKYYNVVDYYITNNRGYTDYDIYNRTPLYTIKLDGETINAIRTYNKTHDYNNFDLTCVNGEYCISNFLRGKADGFDIDLLDSGKSVCKNITPDNFEACLWS